MSETTEKKQMQIVQVKVGDLIPYEKNAKEHPRQQVEKIAMSIREYGFNVPVLVDKNNVVIAGHGRLAAAELEGIEFVPAIYIEHLSEDQVKAFRIADNRVAESRWLKELLKEDLAALYMAGMDLELTGMDLAQLENMLPDLLEKKGKTDADDLPSESETEKRVTAGEIWRCGDHQLMCGDVLEAENCRKLMGGGRAAMLFTDPPYGVSYADKNKFFNAIGNRGNRIQNPIKNDHLKPEQMYQFWKTGFTNIAISMEPGAVYYITAPGGSELMFYLYMALKESGFKLKHTLVWRKNHHVLGRADYNYQHEPVIHGETDGGEEKGYEYIHESIAYGWVKAGHRYYGPASEVSVWDIDRPQVADLHPTMKPVELIKRAIRNSTQPGELVIDFFGGSGSTIIACEQTGRRCNMMEIDAHYCDVILKRWEDFTGRRAERVG